jgi:hypothetical protein
MDVGQISFELKVKFAPVDEAGLISVLGTVGRGMALQNQFSIDWTST